MLIRMDKTYVLPLSVCWKIKFHNLSFTNCTICDIVLLSMTGGNVSYLFENICVATVLISCFGGFYIKQEIG